MRYYLIILMITVCTLCKAQERAVDFQSTDVINTSDMYRMMSLLGINIQKFSLSEKYKDYFCNFIIEEFVDGNRVKSFEARNTIGKLNEFVLNVGDNLQSGRFPISIYSQEYSVSLVKVKTHVGEMEHKITFTKKKNLAYAWKEVFQMGINEQDIIPFKKHPFLIYTSPVGAKFAKTTGASEFCLINGKAVSVEDWNKKLGIKHSFIFYIQLEK